MSRQRAPLTPSERSMRARLGAYAAHAAHDTKETTRAAREASPVNVAYFEALVDPEGLLPEDERLRRAEAARKAHYTKMALASAIARRKAAS